MPNNILITGGSGLVGRAIIKLLQSKGYNIAILSRKSQKNGVKTFIWDYEKNQIDSKAIEFADIIIHLAGENISSKRWTKKQKRRIVDSRVKTSELLYNAVYKAVKKPLKIISASAIGYYGAITSDIVFKEDDANGADFLAQTVLKWEEAIDKFQDFKIPVIKLRFGVVMSMKGGALPNMIRSLKMGFGSFLGRGNQFVPWIGIEELARIVLFMLENELETNVYNAVHPNSITNKQLMKLLSKKYNKFFLPIGVPEFLIRLIYGEMASILLKGSAISSEKIQKRGFLFTENEFI